MTTATPLAGRIPVTRLTPAVPDPRWHPKAFEGEVVPFRATVFREGHDRVGAMLVVTSPSGREERHRMRALAPGTDRWEALVRVDEVGEWRWHVIGFDDEIATWRHDAAVKIDAGVDVELMYELGARLIERAAAETSRPRPVRKRLAELADALRDGRASAAARRALVDAPVLSEFDARPLARLVSESGEQRLLVERRRAGVGAWYEFFPRSEGARRQKDGTWRSGTFRTAAKRLDGVAAMGFDVVYLPPIHPIGVTNRKGRNNTLDPGAGDPGSPWAIGGLLKDGSPGGHDAVHPDLGTLADFRAFVRRANELGIEVALDLALQASPDHPWVAEHPEWFTVLPDGTIRYAENPPKKYQDIYPVNFDDDPEGIFDEVLRIVRHWMKQGVRIFRVDNPHTKPLAFWERLIATVNADDPGVVFLAEAFTRPAMMQALAMAGFQQSYSYFTWRNTKDELEEFLTSVSQDTADFMRPNLFVNTPDILTEYLQFGGPAAFTVRATIAATAAPLWGVYSGFELFESVARPGAEEAIDNEKYEYKPRDFAAAEAEGRSLGLYLGILNRIRAEHPALGQLRNIRFHASEDDAVLVYSKHLDGRFTDDGVDDTLIVVANVDPHSVRETTVHLDLEALGLPPGARFSVDDLVTGSTWDWGASNYVRLDAFTRPVHILHVRRGSDD
ncbi:alpha-1,4-glucan--maltose-1-phosphate maltosyltransferase [Agromyces endophyticus]|uniref:alpha-1,4-glucan--maltose-1-phosphate maltosyltransferase n=1 Tax=Agromyces sp. H17E-10 TaxID=2932244 RepID=UPI001FD49C77|nr:alpha-1,4-glucan--maltose-1-phosphate maltosyltransferase [Agromyces sp. H17E-10]UOQ88905.1 alpha-1,4-glucan--maltose-1-phosphate maltosyltransferase [Agromyces sp. H17E-10]